jgi:hypothetical protein
LPLSGSGPRLFGKHAQASPALAHPGSVHPGPVGDAERPGLGQPAALVVLWPANIRAGLEWRSYYVRGMRESDIAAGVPIPEMAARHRPFPMHWDEDGLRARMRMLREAGIGPFAASRDMPDPDPGGVPLVPR